MIQFFELVKIKFIVCFIFNFFHYFSYFNVFSGEKDYFNIRLEDEVVRGSIILKEGELMWPPPPIAVSAAPPAAVAKALKKEASTAEPEKVDPFMKAFKECMLCTTGK